MWRAQSLTCICFLHCYFFAGAYPNEDHAAQAHWLSGSIISKCLTVQIMVLLNSLLICQTVASRVWSIFFWQKSWMKIKTIFRFRRPMQHSAVCTRSWRRQNRRPAVDLIFPCLACVQTHKKKQPRPRISAKSCSKSVTAEPMLFTNFDRSNNIKNKNIKNPRHTE